MKLFLVDDKQVIDGIPLTDADLLQNMFGEIMVLLNGEMYSLKQILDTQLPSDEEE